MAFVSTTQRTHVAAGFVSAIETLTERFSRYMMYRRTLAELSVLSKREMADLGFSQTNLRAAAYEAFYGVNN